MADQAAAVGWPAVLTPTEVGDDTLGRWLDFCLGPLAAAEVARARARADDGLRALEARFAGQWGGGR